MANIIHLVLGDSAAGCVRAACTTWGMPGTVVGFCGELAYSLLDDRDAMFSQWKTFIAGLALEHPDAVIVWGGDNVSDTIFMALACDRLAGRSEPLLRVRVPGINNRPFVAMHSPEQIARLYVTRRPLSVADRLLLAQDFARIRDQCGPLRRLQQGRVLGATIDYYDPLLLVACKEEWQAAAHVVGAAMGRCDDPNLLSDAFFFERLGFLVDGGSIVANGPRIALRDHSVRLAKPTTMIG